ncbi:hypothetical protein KY346_00450 [Candidatus Woesearchaeota archaeon]|nr:hypothetical protein [Candidatus Woesearchaeota archaeon]
MVYAKKIESAAYVPELIVPNSYFLDKELHYKDKHGGYQKKDNLTVEGMIGIHRIKERRWSAPGETTSIIAKKAVEKLSTRPELLIVGHDGDVPIPAVAGIAQYAGGYKNAAFCDLISNNDLPGTEIAQALIDSGKYKHIICASSPEISEMRTEKKFDKVKFSEAAILFEKGSKPRPANQAHPESIDFVIVDHKDAFESKSDYVKNELDWAGINTLDVIAGCPGYVMSVEIADALIKTNQYKTITCAGAENLEKMADPRHLDYTLYASAAGAATYQASNEPGIICSYFKGFGNLWNYLRLDAGVPLADGTPTGPYLVMEGHQLYRFARREVPKGLTKLIERFREHTQNLDLSSFIFLLHQMNGKLLEHLLCNFFDVPTSVRNLKKGIIPDRIKEIIDNQVPWSVDVYANSSSATIPVTEDHARRGIIRRRFSKKPFGDVLAIGSGTKSLNFSVGAGMILGGFGEIL